MMSKAWSQQAETQPSASYTAVSEQAKHDGKQLLVYAIYSLMSIAQLMSTGTWEHL